MFDYLVSTPGAYDGATLVALVSKDAVYDDEGNQTEPREYLAGEWAVVHRVGDGDPWEAPGVVAELRRGDLAVLRTRDEAILGCLMMGAPTEDGRPVRLELASSSSPDLEPISDRQFAHVLALDKVITEDEALAWAARGDLPFKLLQAVSQIPEEGGQRFAARMLLSSATTYERDHPLVPTLGMMLGYESEALDDIWRRGAAL